MAKNKKAPKSKLLDSGVGDSIKKCSKCKQIKSLDQFSKDRTSNIGYKSRCKFCISLDKKQALTKYRLTNPAKTIKKFRNKLEYRRNCNYLKYGINLYQYEELLKSQNNVCAICKNPETMTKKTGILQNLSVDHCHKTGKVRGLLCSKCNTGIGYFREDIKIFENAIEYIQNKKSRNTTPEES